MTIPPRMNSENISIERRVGLYPNGEGFKTSIDFCCG